MLGVVSSHAQSKYDAIRYALNNTNGTARFTAMSGAFGAVGGDLSAININPAGSAIFANNLAGGTLSGLNVANSSNYFGTTNKTNRTSVDLNQIGAVFVFESEFKYYDWKKFALAINYENTSDFDNKFFTSGVNPTRSIVDYFSSYANGIQKSVLDNIAFSDLFYGEQQAYFGYNAYLFDPVTNTPGNTAYIANLSAGSFAQTNSAAIKGNTGKVAFNFSTQFQDEWFFGLNLNSNFSNYRRVSKFTEENNNNTSTTSNLVKKITFNDEIFTSGSGFSLQLGAIYKPSKLVRLGLSYESPTWYRFTDEVTQSISATSGTVSTNLNPDNVDPNRTIVFEPYSLSTPGKVTGSLALIFGKQGLLSLDAGIKDYKGSSFGPSSDYKNTNKNIDDTFKSAVDVKIGGEVRIKNLSLRGGYRFEQTPFIDKTKMGNLNGFSAGFGYNFGDTKLDFSYSNSRRSYEQPFFSQGFVDGGKINGVNNNFSISLMFEL